MDNSELTLWQAMRGRNRDLMAARVALPVLIALIYGIYKFVVLGVTAEHYLYTYLPVIGAVASLVSLMTFSAVVMTEERSVRAMFGALSGFVPYVFSLYLMGFLGGYGIWQSTNPFSIWGVVKGLFWIVLGYRLLRKFWIITEIASIPVSMPVNEMEKILYFKLGMKPKELLPLLADEQVLARQFNHSTQE